MKTDLQALVEDLCSTASARKVRSLCLIHAICEEQAQRGSNDYSIATIGALSSKQGGPSAAAIRNRPGEDYRALISAYAASVTGLNRTAQRTAATAVDELLEGVVDPVLRVRIKLLLAEVESLRGQLLAARHLANQSAVLELASRPENPTLADGTSPGLFLTMQEVLALKASLSNDSLAHWGWKVDQTGRIVTESGQAVFRAGFATAIKKTLDYVIRA